MCEFVYKQRVSLRFDYSHITRLYVTYTRLMGKYVTNIGPSLDPKNPLSLGYPVFLSPFPQTLSTDTQFLG